MPEELETEEVTAPDSKHFAQLRKKAEKLEAENSTLKRSMIKLAADGAGFDTNAGVVDLVIDRFMADAGDDIFETSKFTEFAKGLGLTPSVSGEITEPAQPPAGDQKPTEAEAQLAQLQANAELLRSASTTPAPSTLATEIADAEAKGDVATSIALKSQQLHTLNAPGLPV